MHLRRDAGEIVALTSSRTEEPLLIFGSPGLVHAFLELDAIDEFWIYPESRAAGCGHSAISNGAHKTKLKLLEPQAVR